MKMSDLEQWISLYLDGELSDRKKIEVTKLLQTNEEAARIYQQFGRLRGMFAHAPPVLLPQDFSKTVVDQINQGDLVDREKLINVSSLNHPFSPTTVFHLRHRQLLVWSSALVVSVGSILLLIGMGIFLPGGRSGGNDIALNVAVDPHQVPLPIIGSTSPAESGHSALNAVPPTNSTLSSSEKSLEKDAYSQLQTPLAPLAGSRVSDKAEKAPVHGPRSIYRLRCELLDSEGTLFTEQFFQFCRTKNLHFAKFSEGNRQIYEFQLTRSDLTALEGWLREQVTLVQNIDIPIVLRQWQNESSNLSTSVPKADQLLIRLELEK